MVWDGWNGFEVDLMNCVIYSDPFYHTLRLIQLNWVVFAYNFNFREYVLTNHESSIGAILLTSLLHFTLLLSFAYHLFPALAEYLP
jgi:hypothetical protein